LDSMLNLFSMLVQINTKGFGFEFFG